MISYSVKLLLRKVTTLEEDFEQAVRDRVSILARAAGLEGFSNEVSDRGELISWRGASDAAQDWSWTLSPPVGFELGSSQQLIEQSWWWEDAGRSLPPTGHLIELSDHRANLLDQRGRLQKFQTVLAGVVGELLERGDCAAIEWTPAYHFVNPQAWLQSAQADRFASLFPGALNVRLYAVDDGSESPDPVYLMDTMGLAALGMPDLQCMFRGLAREDVSQVLFATASYVFEAGPVLRSGHTVQGPLAADEWLCREGEAAAPPERAVVELDPGHPFSA